MEAIWENTIIASSDDTIVVEGNHYFPPESIKKEFFTNSDTRSTCPWKGEAHYADITVGGETNKDAAWFYPEPKEAAENITGYYAFWNGVKVIE